MNRAAIPETSEAISRLVAFPESGSRSVAQRDGSEGLGRWCCEQLERGHILFFPTTPFEFPEEDRAFLLAQRQSGARYHKNVAYRPGPDRMTGFATRDPAEEARLRAILRSYSERAERFLAQTLLPYARGCRRDFASFRPQEERGRPLRLRARNDLLHTDAFPTRPTNGDRILRLFTNLNPAEPRVWMTSETFEALAERYAQTAGLGRIAAAAQAAWAGPARLLGRALGLASARRSPYDAFMLRFHHFLKENESFQQSCPKNRWEFPPGSTWMAFTDMVCHSVLAGRFALEQTFIISRDALVLPLKAPVSVLERLAGCRLTLT
jgi:hypothetical protein